MVTKTPAELLVWKAELNQALSSSVPMPEAIVKDIVSYFNQTDSAAVFPRAAANPSAHVLVAQISNMKTLGATASSSVVGSAGAGVLTTNTAAAPDQTVIDASLFLVSLFLEATYGSDVLTRVALPIANQTAINLAGYLAATLPSTAAPNTQDEEAVFTRNPFATGAANSSYSNFNSVGYSSTAKAAHVYHSNPRMAAVQALLTVTRRFQLSAAFAKELGSLAEKHIMGYMGLCQLYGDVANVSGGGASNKHKNPLKAAATTSAFLGGGNGSSGGPSAALTTFMTIQHNVTHLVLMSYANTYSSWGNVFGGSSSSVTYEPNALLKDNGLGKDASTWINALHSKVTDSANAHIDAISASMGGGLAPLSTVGGGAAAAPSSSTENTAARDRARAAIVKYVDGFVAIVTLVVGLFRIAQNDLDRGMDLIIEAFRGDRREINSPDGRSNDLKVFVFRGKVTNRLVNYCPPAARLRLPNWFIPEIYFDILNTVTSDTVLPAIKHLSDLDVESCRIYTAALEEVSMQRQQQAALQQSMAANNNAMGLYGGLGGMNPSGDRHIGRTGSALTGAPASTVVSAPKVACYPYTSIMSSLCNCIAFVFTVLPGRYLREDTDAIVESTASGLLMEASMGGSVSDPEAFAANDNNIATFVFRNYIYHLRDLYEISGKSGIDSYAAAASGALGLASASSPTSANANGSGLWDVFALRASAAYSGLLAQIASVDPMIAARIFTTVIGESQGDCTELQWTNLLRQVSLALSTVPTASANDATLANSNDPFRFSEVRSGYLNAPLGSISSSAAASAAAAASASAIPELGATVMQQASPQALIAFRQSFATSTLLLIANVATQLSKSPSSASAVSNNAISRAIPAEALLSLLETRMLSPDALGAILTATSALINNSEQRKNCWLMLEQKGLLRISSASTASGAASTTTNSGANSWAPAMNIVADAEINSLPGHCMRECRVGSYPITIAFLRLLLKLIAIPSTTVANSVAANATAAPSAGAPSAADYLSGNTGAVVSVPTASAEATAILTTPTFRSLLKFVADDIVCTLNRRSYNDGDDLYEMAALSTELLHDALLTFGPNVAELSGANVSGGSPTTTTSSAAPSASGFSTVSSSTSAAFHTLLATARAPNDVLTQLLIHVNEAVADIQADHPLSATRMASLRVTVKLLYAAMFAIKVDKSLANAVYTFNARTYDNTEFTISILRLCCGVCHTDEKLARRCLAILGLIDSVVMSTTARMILSSTCNNHSDLRDSARYILASVIDAATSNVVSTATTSTVDTFGLPAHIESLDRDHLADADVPSIAACLLDLLIHNVRYATPSLTTWLCGYDLSGSQITWEGGCLEVIIAKVNDAHFRSNPATAPLATRCIQLIYGLLCNPTTATNSFHNILAARGNHGFLRSVHSIAAGANASDFDGGYDNNNSVAALRYSEGISIYDTVSTERHSIALHQLDFAGYAFRIMSLHLHRLSQQGLADKALVERAMREEHEVNGINLKSSYQGLVGTASRGRFTDDAVRVGGTSVMATSHDPLVVQLRKMIRLFGGASASSASSFSSYAAGGYSGVVDSDISDSEMNALGGGGVSAGASAVAYGRRMVEVLERLPAYPVLSVPGGSTDAFIVQSSKNVPQYSIPALSVAFAHYTNGTASREEIRESLRIFVFANSCLLAYNAATCYIRGWCELLEVVCANTNPAELSLDRLMSLAEEIVAAVAITDKLTIAAQQEVVIALSQALCAVVMKMSEVRGVAANGPKGAEAERVWAGEGSHALQSLLTVVIRTLVKFRDVSAPSRLNLYNVIRVLLSLAPLQVEPFILPEDREPIMNVIINDICSANATSLADGALSGYLSPDTSSELVSLQCLRRFLQIPDTLAFFAISTRTTVNASNTVASSGDVTSSAAVGGSSSIFIGSSANNDDPNSAAAAESFWSPSARLVAVVKAIFKTIDAVCCALFSGGGNVFAHAAFVLEYVECASDILALLARAVPHVLYNSGAAEAAFGMQCWELVNRSLNDQGSVAVITARHLVETNASANGVMFNHQNSNIGNNAAVPPHIVRLFADVGTSILSATISWVNVLFTDKPMRQHLSLVRSCADFLRLQMPLFQCVCKSGSFGAKNAAIVAAQQQQGGGAVMDAAITPIHTAQLRLVEEVSLFLASLSSSHIANECRSLIQLLGLTDLMLSLTAPEMLTQPFFVDEEAEAANASAAASNSPYVRVPVGTITYAQIGHVARTVRNLSSFLLSTVHPILLRQKQQEAAAIGKIPKISAQLTRSQSVLSTKFSQSVDPNASSKVGDSASSAPARLASTPEDVWPLLEAAFLTTISVLLHQLTIATSTTIEWEVRTKQAGTWHSKPYMEAITSITLLAHSAVLQCLLMRKDQPHLFASTSTDTNAKALTFHVKHLAASLRNSLGRLTDVLGGIMAAAAEGGAQQHHHAGVAVDDNNRSAAALFEATTNGGASSLADALNKLNGTANGASIITAATGAAAVDGSNVRSRLTGGAAYDGRTGEYEDVAAVNGAPAVKKVSYAVAQLSHAGTMQLYQGVQRARSLVLAACRDAEQLFVEQL